ncbi:GPP34 family phosphoprotein [Nonomuraea sp. NPDC050556]|uniref:GOLPH3/VPS74 family protein n=1 Tax=Nonomuraea sp. NPDC050556 TaxID=3364369 RepID=UPI0037BE06F0
MLPLASELFLAGWDTTKTGQPLIHRKGLALALAGGLLAELTLHERLAVRDEHLAVVQTRPTGDRLLDHTLGVIADAREHTAISTWLAYLSQHAIVQVAERLIAVRLVKPVQPRVLKHRPPRYEFDASWSDAAWPPDRIRTYLCEPRPLDAYALALIALANACGLTEALLDDPKTRQDAMTHLHALLPAVPPPLGAIAGHVRVAVAEAVLTHRT